jgi:hypothetical protein
MKNLFLAGATAAMVATLGGCAEMENHPAWGVGFNTPVGGVDFWTDGNKHEVQGKWDFMCEQERSRGDAKVAEIWSKEDLEKSREARREDRLYADLKEREAARKAKECVLPPPPIPPRSSPSSIVNVNININNPPPPPPPVEEIEVRVVIHEY